MLHMGCCGCVPDKGGVEPGSLLEVPWLHALLIAQFWSEVLAQQGFLKKQTIANEQYKVKHPLPIPSLSTHTCGTPPLPLLRSW